MAGHVKMLVLCPPPHVRAQGEDAREWFDTDEEERTPPQQTPDESDDEFERKVSIESFGNHTAPTSPSKALATSLWQDDIQPCIQQEHSDELLMKLLKIVQEPQTPDTTADSDDQFECLAEVQVQHPETMPYSGHEHACEIGSLVVSQEQVEARAEPPAWGPPAAAVELCRLSERRHPAKAGARLSSAEVGTGKGASEKLTTVMMRNVPNNYTRQMLLNLVDAQGFAGHYDFFYLPMDFGTRRNVGYAFINFSCWSSATAFWQVFDGFSRWSLTSRKVCKLGWSNNCQGRDANVNLWRNSPVMCDAVPEDFKPIVFSEGKQTWFPAPTKTLRPPKTVRSLQ